MATAPQLTKKERAAAEKAARELKTSYETTQARLGEQVTNALKRQQSQQFYQAFNQRMDAMGPIGPGIQYRQSLSPDGNTPGGPDIRAIAPAENDPARAPKMIPNTTPRGMDLTKPAAPERGPAMVGMGAGGPDNPSISPEQIRAEIERRKAAKAAPVAQGITPEQIQAEINRRRSRSELDAGINELAAQIPGGYEAFKAAPADPERMAALGYVQDLLSQSGYAKANPQVQPDQTQYRRVEVSPGVTRLEPINPQNTGNAQNGLLVDVMRGIEAPIARYTGGGLEGWARTATENPLLGASQAVDFISPVDDLGRAYKGAEQAGAGAIEGDWAKAGRGLQQLSTEGSYAAMQMLPGSMAAKGMGARAAPTTLAEAQAATVAASRAPALPKQAPQVAAPPEVKPFSVAPEPVSKSNVVARNADRIVGGAIGAGLGGAGDAIAASGDGTDGGPDIINPATGAIAGMVGGRFARRGGRNLLGRIRPAGFDERVAARAVRNALASSGIRSADEARAAGLARFGDKPAAVADLSQEGIGMASGVARMPGATGEVARSRYADLSSTRAGRIERDIGQANPALSTATITGDVDALIAEARAQATPVYEQLRSTYTTLDSPRLQELAQLDLVRPHVNAINRYRDTLATTEGRTISDFEYWDLVKRSIDKQEQSLSRTGQPVPFDLDSARQAIVDEMDRLVPEYAAARELGGVGPKIKADFELGQKLLGGKYRPEDVARIVSEITGRPPTGNQAGVIRSMLDKNDNPRTAIAALTSPRAQGVLREVFGADVADELQRRFLADAQIMQNAGRINPNVGSVTAQAMQGGGLGPTIASAIQMARSPAEAALAALSRSGAYSRNQRDIMGQMLLGGITDENLARIFPQRGPRNALSNAGTPPAPRGPSDAGFVDPSLLGPVVGAGAGYMAAPEDRKLEGTLLGLGAGAVGGRMLKGPSKGASKTARNALASDATGFEAYHASPWDFSAFEYSPRTAKQGEGTNAFGKGLYFAENKKVSQSYKKRFDEYLRNYHSENGRAPKATLYKARINNPQQEFFDWDAPIMSTKNAQVIPQLDDIAEKHGAPFLPNESVSSYLERVGSIEGMAPYGDLVDEFSDVLKQAGYPGVQYFDRASRYASRSTKNRTRNFAVFDPSAAQIIQKNGRAVPPPKAPRNALSEVAPPQRPLSPRPVSTPKPQPAATINTSRSVANLTTPDGKMYDVKADLFTDRDAAVMSPMWPSNIAEDLSEALKHRRAKNRAQTRGMDLAGEAPRSPEWEKQYPDQWADAQKQVADKFVQFAGSTPQKAHILALVDNIDINSLATRIEAQLPAGKTILKSSDNGELAIVDSAYLRTKPEQFQRWQSFSPTYNQKIGVLPQPAPWARDGFSTPQGPKPPSPSAPKPPPAKNGFGGSKPPMDEAPHARLPKSADFQRSWVKATNAQGTTDLADPEMGFKNYPDLTTDLIEVAEPRIKSLVGDDVEISTKTSVSNVSPSAYIEVTLWRDDDILDTLKIRVSDHADRYGADATIRVDGRVDDVIEDGKFDHISAPLSRLQEMVDKVVSETIQAAARKGHSLRPAESGSSKLLAGIGGGMGVGMISAGATLPRDDKKRPPRNALAK